MTAATSITINNGKSVAITVEWFKPNKEVDTPTSVRYQVFDWLTGDPTGAAVELLELGSVMNFTVPANLLVNDGSTPVRRLAIEIEGVFTNADDTDSERVDVSVLKSFPIGAP